MIQYAVLDRPVGRARDAPLVRRRIRFAERGEQATMVLKLGGFTPLRLVFVEPVHGKEVREFAINERAWKIEGIDVSVDGTHYEAAAADALVLAPSTKKIEFGAPVSPESVVVAPKTVEFRQRTGSHG